MPDDTTPVPGSSAADERMERMLGRLLQAGVVLAAAVVLTGAVVYLTKYGAYPPEVGVFRGEPADLRSPIGIVRAAFDGRGRGLIQLGLLLLVATPVARVALSLLSFVRQRDWMYVGITGIVLALLVGSLFLVGR
jgi:uncharacterized membrane protein